MTCMFKCVAFTLFHFVVLCCNFAAYIHCQTQGPMLHYPFKKVRDHVKGSCDYP